MSLFRNFISPEELLEIGVYCSGLLKMNSVPVQQMAITLLGQILSSKEREINDNMDARIDTTSFYSKYYMNPRKVKVRINERRVYHSGNVFPAIETILQNLYNYVSTKTELEPASLICLEKIFKVMENKVSSYGKPLAEMFKVLFKQLVNGYTYDGLKYIFESLGTFISNAKDSNETKQIILTDILNEVNELMNKGINDVNCFLLQIYAIIIQTFGDMPEATMVVRVYLRMCSSLRWSVTSTLQASMWYCFRHTLHSSKS